MIAEMIVGGGEWRVLINRSSPSTFSWVQRGPKTNEPLPSVDTPASTRSSWYSSANRTSESWKEGRNRGRVRCPFSWDETRVSFPAGGGLEDWLPKEHIGGLGHTFEVWGWGVPLWDGRTQPTPNGASQSARPRRDADSTPPSSLFCSFFHFSSKPPPPYVLGPD